MQHRTNLILTSFFSFIIGGLATFTYQSFQVPLIHSEVVTHSEVADLPESNNAENLASCLSLLEIANSQVHSAQLKSLAVKPVIQSADLSVDNETSRGDLALNHALEVRQKTQEFSDWLHKNAERNQSFNLESELTNKFEQESVDFEWAASQEQELYNLFSSNTELAGFALKSAQCKTTECRISVGIESIDQANQLVEMVGQLLHAKNKERLLSLYAAPNHQMGYTTIFLKRD